MITLDKAKAANAVLLELMAERHRLAEALDLLKRKHGSLLDRTWEQWSADRSENTAAYDDWLESRGLQSALDSVNTQIVGLRDGDFSFA